MHPTATSDSVTNDVSESTPKRRRVRLPKPPPPPIKIHPTFWPIAFLELMGAWLTTRRWLVFLACLPVLGFTGFVCWAAVYGNMIPPKDQTRHYLMLADEAEKLDDKETHEICYRKLSNLPLESTVKYQVAIFLVGRQRLDQARVLMNELAPSDRKGYPLAHKWVAIDKLKSLGRQDPKSEVPRDLLFHAKVAADNLTNDSEAISLYGLLLVRGGRLEEALDYFTVAAQSSRDQYLTVGEIEQRLGRTEDAKVSRARAKDHFRSVLRDSPKDIDARINLVRVMLPDNEVKEAIATLREGLVLQDDSRLRIAIADCSIWKYDSLTIEEREGPAGLSLLNYALVHMPTHSPTLERIAIVTTEKSDKTWEAMRERLQESLTEGTAPATCHLLLANGHLQRKEYDKARFHLELANRIDPQMIVVLNNLAWLMASVEPIDINRAEALIDQAAQLVSPSNLKTCLEVLETRGQIKLKLNKYSEAISDLERILAHYSNHKKVRTALAQAYEGRGDFELAAKYRH